MGCGGGNRVLLNSIRCRVSSTVYKPFVKTLMVHFWSGGRAESTGSLTEKPSRIHSPALWVGSAPVEYSAIKMAVCGSEQQTGGLCTYIKEGPMYFWKPMGFLAMTLVTFLRIVKALFGYLRLRDSTAFVTLPSPRLRRSRVC